MTEIPLILEYDLAEKNVTSILNTLWTRPKKDTITPLPSREFEKIDPLLLEGGSILTKQRRIHLY